MYNIRTVKSPAWRGLEDELQRRRRLRIAVLLRNNNTWYLAEIHDRDTRIGGACDIIQLGSTWRVKG